MKPVQTKEGYWIIDLDSHVGHWIRESGRLDHDRHIHALIEEGINPGWICIDAGALYGDTTIGMCRATGGEGAVFAIEANPMAFECLYKNAEKFQSPVFCMNVALSDSHGGECVHIMEENVGASKVSGDSKNSEPSRIETKIKTISIDGLCIDANLTTGIDFIKLDIEGGEMAALKGARNLLSNKHPQVRRPVMVIEMNSFALSLQGACYKDIYDFLLEMGYEWRLIQPEAVPSSMQYDILCWPNPELDKPKLYKAEVINPVPA